MAITSGPGGTTITGSSIGLFRLLTLKHAVALELKGIKVRRGPVVWKMIAREFNIKGNKQAVYDWLDARLKELAPQAQNPPVTVRGHELP